jgi:LacI family fructose operon transcriptional repressor
VTTNNHRRATIYHLSQKTGVSPSTISAVLNGTWRNRRISTKTAEMIIAFAEENQYMPNVAAQGLRKSFSRLVGLIIPSHDSRFFATIAQSFEFEVRRRQRFPIVVSSARDPQREQETARTLISYSIEALVVCGATDPDSVHDICDSLGVPHVNIDLPGLKASSVISDNVHGGEILTTAIARKLSETSIGPNDIHFFGGVNDAATRDRVRGFEASLSAIVGSVDPAVIHLTGYSTKSSQQAFEDYYEKHNNIPRGIFVNGPNNYEGFLRFASNNKNIDLFNTKIGCYDYDPLASFSIFETWMIRQDADKMMAKAFDILDEKPNETQIYYIEPKLIPPRSSLPL